MNNYVVSVEYTDIRTYIKKHLGKPYAFDGQYFYRRCKSFIFWKKEKIGDFYTLIFNPGNDYQITASDKNFLDHIEPICTQYKKLTNDHYDFRYRLDVFKELE